MPNSASAAYPRSDAMEEWRDVDLGDKASYSESERYKNDSRREWWLEITNPVPKFPDPDGPMASKGLRPDKASYLQRFQKITKKWAHFARTFLPFTIRYISRTTVNSWSILDQNLSSKWRHFRLFTQRNLSLQIFFLAFALLSFRHAQDIQLTI